MFEARALESLEARGGASDAVEAAPDVSGSLDLSEATSEITGLFHNAFEGFPCAPSNCGAVTR